MATTKTVTYGIANVQRQALDTTDYIHALPLKSGAGTVFILTSLHGVHGAESVKEHELFLSTIFPKLEAFVAREKGTDGTEQRFEETVQEINRQIKTWLEHHPRGIDLAKSSVSLLLLCGKTLFLTGFGQFHGMYLHPETNGSIQNVDLLEDIRHEGIPEKDKVFRSVIMGEFEGKDALLVANNALLRAVTKKDLEHILLTLAAPGAAEQIKVIAEERTDRVFALVLRASTTESASQTASVTSADELLAAEKRTESVLTASSGGFLAFLPKVGPAILAAIRSFFGFLGSLVLVFVRSIIHFFRATVRTIFERERKLHKAREEYRASFAHLGASIKGLFTPSPFIAAANLFIFILLISLLVHQNTLYQKQRADAAREALVAQVTQISKTLQEAESQLIYRNEAGARAKLAEASTLFASRTAVVRELGATERIERQIQSIGAQLRREKTLTPKPLMLLPDPGAILLSADGATLAATMSGALFKDGTALAATTTGVTLPFRNENAMYLLHAGGDVTKVDAAGSATSMPGTLPTTLRAAVFYNSSLYGILQDSGVIVKSNAASSGWSTPKHWLKNDDDAVSGATTIAIDGDVYVGTPTSITQYRRGARTNWTQETADPAVKQMTKIWTSPDTSFVYALEPSANRILVYTKDTGSFLKQYLFPSLHATSDFLVDEKRNVLILLDGTSVYQAAME